MVPPRGQNRPLDPMSLLLRYRYPLVVAFHLAAALIANLLAFWLRFDSDVPPWAVEAFVHTVPVLVLLRGLTFWPLGLYDVAWGYASFGDLVRIVTAVAASSGLFAIVEPLLFGTSYPKSVLVVDGTLLICLLSAFRLSPHFYRELSRAAQGKRVLVYGAGDAGEMIVREMHNHPAYGYQPVGFVDDDPTKRGQRIRGVRVYGTLKEITTLVERLQPTEILLAIPSATPATVRALVQTLEPLALPIKTLPNIRDLLECKVTVTQIRDLSLEDLLARPAVGLDNGPIRALVSGRRVMVTGAGGSIGSELCRQLAMHAPASLVMLDRYENSLFELEHQVAQTPSASVARAVIADVTDASRLDHLFADLRPEIVFHAAAHKHVPLMELNPCEAVKNNVAGTFNVARAADRHGAERFILISTDKAVNPANVMGATKRVAEFAVQVLFKDSRTRFCAVRFGNVLGSNGSVVPLFLQQIARGGPVTVTHPDIKRYFMLIPEAVQLVQHAAVQCEPGAVYVLDMGDQVRVDDLARALIRLSGYSVDQDIEIRYIGLRPGEKLHEELVGRDERVTPSDVAKINRVQPFNLPTIDVLSQHLEALRRCATDDDATGVLRMLREIVPTYRQDAEQQTPAVDGSEAGVAPTTAPALGVEISSAALAGSNHDVLLVGRGFATEPGRPH